MRIQIKNYLSHFKFIKKYISLNIKIMIDDLYLMIIGAKNIKENINMYNIFHQLNLMMYCNKVCVQYSMIITT